MRRRRPRVVWLPPDRFNRWNVPAGTGAVSGTDNGIGEFFLDVVGGVGGASATAVVPVVQDAQSEVTNIVSGSLADVEQSAYRLRRVVGKIFVSASQIAEVGLAPEIVVTAGLIVLRSREAAGQIVPLADLGNYDTQALHNWADPWIWRRTWILGNIPQETAQAVTFWPESNAEYGSAVDGPHVDVKTARIVGPEERLYLVVTGTVNQGNEQLSNRVRCIFDLRVLASMRSSQGNRRNASR